MFGYIMMKELDGKVYNTRVDWNYGLDIFYGNTTKNNLFCPLSSELEGKKRKGIERNGMYSVTFHSFLPSYFKQSKQRILV
jgi:hypothetical protein